VTIANGSPPVAAVSELVTVSGLIGLEAGDSLTVNFGAGSRVVTAGLAATTSVQVFTVDGIEDNINGNSGFPFFATTAGLAETMTFSIAGQTITFSAQDTFVLGVQTNNAFLTAAQVAAAFASQANGSLNGVTWTVSGAVNPQFSVAAVGDTLVFTGTAPGVRPDLSVGVVASFGTNDTVDNTAPIASLGNTLGTNASTAGVTAANLAQMLATGVAIPGATVTNSAFPAVTGAVLAGNVVEFTGPAGVNLPNATGTATDEPPTVTVVREGAPAIAGVPEVATFTFVDLSAGQSITLAGRTVTATGDVSAEAVAQAFVDSPTALNVTLNGIQVTGAIGSGFTPTTLAGATVTLTGPLDNVANLQATASGLAGTIVLQNMTSGDTLELTGASTGTHQAVIIDAGLNTNDVLNLVLSNTTGAGRNYGTVATSNVETVNLTLNAPAGTTNTPAAVEAINLNIAQTTTLVVAGNNGVDITHNATGLTVFDASGVVGNAGDTRANLGVSFQSLNNTAGASVTITGGVGNDDFIGGGARDTFNLGNGGSDSVQFAATRNLNGQDTINGFTGGTTSSGDVLLLAGGAPVNVVDGNTSSAASIIFNATPGNTASPLDLVLTGNNTNVYLVTDGSETINLANIKDFTAATAQNGEILLGDGVSAYVLHAQSAGSNTFTVYRVFDAAGTLGTPDGVIDVRSEVLGTVNMTNTFGNLVDGNFEGFTPPASTLTAADVAAATAPMAGMMAPLDNFASFSFA
jgi:hypothetical protein